MKYAIFSDIHSNWEALKKYIAHTSGLGLKWICLGDVVGYASHPNECIQLLREHNIPVLMGNHDSALLKAFERRKFNLLARSAIEWHAKEVTPANRQWLGELPLGAIYQKLFSVTHADFSSPGDFPYIITAQDAQRSLAAMKTIIGFYGHTHIPMVFAEDPKKAPGEEGRIVIRQIRGIKKFALQTGKRYLINPGSLGQPRDGDPRMSYVIFDTDEMTVSYQRLEYDYHLESKSILEAKLPPQLAERLLVGA
ncbi:MAG: metallophosphoesterase family protein [Candidatus Omnitrophota bacterium]